MNKTLEEMALTLYRHWFVNFGPFQDGEFEETELGLIPKGWEIKKLSDISTLTMGLSPKSSTYNTQGIGTPLLNGAADFNGTLITPTKFTTEPKRVCKVNDLVFCIRATIGNLTYAEKPYCLGRGVAAVTPKQIEFNELIYFLLYSSIEKLKQTASGSVILGLSKPDIENIKFPLPNNEVVRKFHRASFDLLEMMRKNDIENSELEKTREYLLPRLLSGVIELKKAEKQVEEML